MKGTSTPDAISIATFPASTIMSAIDAPTSLDIDSYISITLVSCAGLFASQSFCGANLILEPFAPPRISEPLKVDALAHAVSTIS